MYKLFVLAAVLFVAVSAEPEAKPQIPSMYPQHYGVSDAYKYNPFGYDAMKYPYQYGSYPYSMYGSQAYQYQTGYPQHYGMYPYSALGQYPYSGMYNNPLIGRY